MTLRNLGIACLAFVLAAGAAAEGEHAPQIRAADLERDVRFLADDARGGRLTGTAGAEQAAAYVAAAFERAGLQPAPGLDDWFQPFDFTSGVRLQDGANRLGEQEPFKLGEQFVPLTFSGNGEAAGELVFVGYGIVEPDDDGYDSYVGVEVKGKIVLALRDVPEAVEAERRQELALYAGDRYKAKLAADRGAAGFLLVIGPNSANAGELVRFRESDRVSAIPIPAASITQAAADALLAPAGKTIAQLQGELDNGKINPHASAPTGGRLTMAVGLERVRGTCRNVLGYLPPSAGVDEILLIGAHYDHIGDGEGLGSLAKKDEQGQVHNGADDNASGTSVVLELAAATAAAAKQTPDAPRRGVLFAAWSGEELGLVGSDWFTEHPPVALDKVVAYFNFDMVGRLRDNRLIVQAAGSSSRWRGLLERRNVPVGFDLAIVDDPYLPTDMTALYTKNVPGLSFFTDLHGDYNRPTDDAATLDYAGMERVARLGQLLLRDVMKPAEKIDYVRVQQTQAPSSGMGRRVYTGMVPDFGGSSGVEGMLISDVRPGGPAEQAGLAGGDVVVEFAGKSVGSLQDYSDALRGAKIGETVGIVVMRDGKRVELEITPAARGQ